MSVLDEPAGTFFDKDQRNPCRWARIWRLVVRIDIPPPYETSDSNVPMNRDLGIFDRCNKLSFPATH